MRPSRVRVVPNGIDAARFAHDEAARHATRRRLGLAPDAYVVGGVGRLAPGKRFDTLIHALPELPPDVRLLLVGEGAERARLERLAQSRGVTGRVVWAGAVGAGELPGLLSAMDVFVSPSADEAFGLAVVEALAAGLPARYVACPALDDLPPGEAPGARRIGGTAADVAAAVREARAEGARRLPVPPAARRYDIACSARQLMTLYSEPLPRLTRETSDR